MRKNESCGGIEMSAMLPPSPELAGALPFLSPQEVEELRPYLTMRTAAAGDVLVQPGDPGDFMAFLLSGRLAVKKETAFPGKYILVAVIEPGGMVGEIAAVEKGRRNAMVVAMEECRLLVLSAEAMARLLAENHLLGIKVLKRIIHVLGQRLRQASERLSRIL
ncbi:MAG: cyclic nucleotide-binding domain-containing protein [Thermodesulfobacteriota bacterium]